jgi:cell wall-associated NlpC family hydrolase
VATPRTALNHALVPFPTDASSHARRTGASRGRASRLRSSLLVGGAATLMLGLFPATAAADPDQATTAEQAAQLVAEASHQLEVVTEQVNEAREVLQRQQAAVDSAEQAAADAAARLDALDGQIRQLARTAYTGEGISHLDLLMTSDSAEDFVSQLGTLDVIAGHANDVLAEVSVAAEAAEQSQAAADSARDEAERTLAEVEAQQGELEAKIADYQRQYDALSAPQRAQADAAHGGVAVTAVPTGAPAPTAAAQRAVDTALAQVGDPYVWGAGGPDAFDCSGLTQYAYSAAGISLPHSSRMQSQMGAPVSRAELQPGDLIFYYSPVSHVAMYIGNGQMVHASTYGKPVQVVSVDSMSGYNSARRIAV